MVKCDGCKYLEGYTEYGHEFLYCKYPTNEKHPRIIDDLSELSDVVEIEHDCGNWCSYLVNVPFEWYMSLFSQMLNRLGI